jgi:hypothetical protein
MSQSGGMGEPPQPENLTVTQTGVRQPPEGTDLVY